MKAYKYHRFKEGIQISVQSYSLNESIIYIPELKKILYNGYDGVHMRHYFGVCDSDIEKWLIIEAEEYIKDIKSGLPKHVLSIDLKIKQPYSSSYSSIPSKASEQKSYIKIISEKKEPTPPIPFPGTSNTTIIKSTLSKDLILSDFEEIDLDITMEEIQKIEDDERKLKEIEENKKSYKKKFFS